MNLLLLSLFASEAREHLADATLGTPMWYRPLLVVPFTPARGRRATQHLVAVLESPGPFVFVTTERPLEGARAPERFTTLSGRRVSGVSPVAGDRIISIDAEASADGASGPLSLTLRLYGAQGSALLHRGDSILESLGARRSDGSPSPARRSLVDITASALETAMSLTVADGAHSPQELVAGMNGEIVRAFTADAGFDAGSLVAFRDALVRRDSPFRLVAHGKLGNAVPMPPGVEGAGVEGTFGPFSSAVDGCETVGGAILAQVKKRILDGQARPIRKKLASQRKLLDHLGDDLERARGHERVRREAEVLAAYQSTVKPGSATVELPDIYDSAKTVCIKLDPAAPLQKQIEKRFKKATKLEKSETHTRRRLELVHGEIAQLEAALRLLDASASFAEALVRLDGLFAKFDIELGGDPAGGTRTPAAPSGVSGRRHYDLGNGWYALVGRNNKDNDELTFRHAAPTDWWFHAQSVPGSHVVLKTSRPSGSPPVSVVERAASLAAHFSKARHSGLVPVIYTQRKYVRKFRGAKPGQVTCEREKMLMVEPILPEAGGD